MNIIKEIKEDWREWVAITIMVVLSVLVFGGLLLTSMGVIG